MIHFVSIPSIAKRQSGVVLLISLIMLLALTLIGITSSNVTGLEGKMAANSKNTNLAFQAAESALRAAEASLVPPPSGTGAKPTFVCNATAAAVATGQGTNGFYSSVYGGSLNSDGSLAIEPSSNPYDFSSSVNWDANANPKLYAVYSNVINGVNKLVGLYQAPAYIIEELAIGRSGTSSGNGSLEGGIAVINTPGSIHTFRITAHGWGGDQNSVATVQSIIRVTYNPASIC